MKKQLHMQMDRWIKIWVLLGLLAISWLISVGERQVHAAILQRGISREVLRFHVLANSDGDADQSVKLKVRDEILRWLEGELSEEEQKDLQKMEKRIGELLPQIEQLALQVLEDNGFSYGARVSLARDYFPVRTYGDCTFPAGIYTALRICLGNAEGHNWWCILFPRLCFADCVHAVLPEESQEQLHSVLTEEEYESLFDPAADEYKIKFRYF